MKLLKKLAARYRMWWGFCPECNSSAPYLDVCPVCCSYREPFPPSKQTKKHWWYRWECKNTNKWTVTIEDVQKLDNIKALQDNK